MEKMKITLKDYKRLPYKLYLEPMRDSDGSNYWTAEYIELRGCKTEGTTEADAVANLQELFDDYILAKIESNAEIPVPLPTTLANEEITLIVQRRKFPLPTSAVAEDSKETTTDIKYKEFPSELIAA
jgi:predicted RNase H-like HicB family nuclease